MLEKENKALIVASAETFTVRGLAMKLKSIGVLAAFAPPRMSEINAQCEDCDLIVLYTDDTVIEATSVLVFLKDYCTEKNKKIVIIGSSEEHEVVMKTLKEGNVFRFFERPLNMELFLDETDRYFSEASQQAMRKSILIVDDDVTYMTMIMDWLKDAYRVSVANSGMQAITWLANNHPDLILLDYEMPVTTGPQVLEMIKSDSNTSNIPVIFLTGKGDKESIMKVLALKPAGYLLKSVDKNGLRENIADYFAKHSS
ncbi:MAG: response regulator [Lachnospiraceae bacterium]|nr:response regulator [Lachnospiraceae bacterium]